MRALLELRCKGDWFTLWVDGRYKMGFVGDVKDASFDGEGGKRLSIKNVEGFLYVDKPPQEEEQEITELEPEEQLEEEVSSDDIAHEQYEEIKEKR